MKNIRLLLTALAAMLATNVVNAENKIAFVTTAASLADLQANGDDDEKAAATWFAAEYPAPTGTILSTSDAGNWDLSQYAAVWIAIDRVGIGEGLPSELTEGTVLNKVKNYYQAGGNLLLTNHATRYLVNLERTTRFPGIKGDGAGSDNTEVWGVNTIIGSSYDHSEDFLYEGMTPDLTEGTSKKVYNLIGSGYKEDHNSMWDLNAFGYNGTPNIVVNFETENNATVLATWQQVTDYQYAGIVDFHETGSYGECIAIGVAAYEWNQNSGTNPYQANIRRLTKNALDKLKTASDLVVTENLTISEDKSYYAIAVNAGIALTIDENVTVNAKTITLQSDNTGTATLLNNGMLNIAETAHVQQYLSTADSREWYYLASPVTGATSALFGASDMVGNYTEATTSYSNPFTEATSLETGRGYVVKLVEASNPTYTFSGALNDGAVNISVTRTGDTAPKRGFNLVGNPYPSYLDWDAAYNANTSNVQSTIWTRTFETGEMVFKTYNADAQTGTDDQTTAHIAPLQAFWVKVPAEKADAGNLTLELTNAQRLHKSAGDANLRTAKAERQLLRLQVSNGTNTDKAVILFDENADNGFDSYDSEKMSNDNAAIPEIYTLAGTQEVAINSFAGAASDREVALGFRTQTAGTFTISAVTLNNLEKVILIDNVAGGEYDLTVGNYTFTSDATDNADRFTRPANTDRYCQCSNFHISSLDGKQPNCYKCRQRFYNIQLTWSASAKSPRSDRSLYCKM